MQSREAIRRLGELLQLDRSAGDAYQTALGCVHARPLVRLLGELREAQARRVEELETAIRELGGSELHPATPEPLVAPLEALAGTPPPEQALKALRLLARHLDDRHSDALAWDMPPAQRHLLRDASAEARDHLERLEHALRDRAWEAPRPEA